MGRGRRSGSRPRQPVYDTQDLSSSQSFSAVYLLSEGPIEGIVGDGDGIFLDGTQVTRGGVDQFNSVRWSLVTGDSDNLNLHEPGLALAALNPSTVTSYSRPVKDGDVSVDILNPNVNQLKISLFWERMEFLDSSNGDRKRTSVEFQIGFAWGLDSSTVQWTQVQRVEGRSTTPFSRSYVFDLSGSPPLTVRIRRVTPPDADDSGQVRDFSLRFISEVVKQPLLYPGSALLTLSAKAEEFASIPQVTVRTRGLRVLVPSNAIVREDGSLDFEGEWDGGLVGPVWCSDPVWILYDLLTNERYGLGKHLEEEVAHLSSFYQASRYSSEQVIDREGETSPRFSLNKYFSGHGSAYSVINVVANSLRAMPYYGSGVVHLAQDAPQDPKFLLSRSNVTAAGFMYESSSQRLKPNVVIVPWFDLEDRQQRLEQVESESSVLKRGAQVERMGDMGLTSRSQARRMGRWFLYTEQEEGLIMSCTLVPPEGLYVRPGDVVRVADPLLAGTRMGGRINGWELEDQFVKVWIDSDTTKQQELMASVVVECVGERQVTAPPLQQLIENGSWTLWLDADLFLEEGDLRPPLEAGQWMGWTDDVNPALYRVINVVEREQGGACVYPMTAIAHNPGKFSFVEEEIPLDRPSLSIYQRAPQPPSGLIASEISYVSNSFLKTKILLSWDKVPGVGRYMVSWNAEDNWTDQETRHTELEIRDAIEETYIFRVWSINVFGVFSRSYSEARFTPRGQYKIPEPPQNVQILIFSLESLIMTWKPSEEASVIHGGKTLIRITTESDAFTWETSEQIGIFDGNVDQAILPARAGLYLIRFESATGVPSPVVSVSAQGLGTDKLVEMKYRIFTGESVDLFTGGWNRIAPENSHISQPILFRCDKDSQIVGGDIDSNVIQFEADDNKNRSVTFELAGLPGAYPLNLRILAVLPGKNNIDAIEEPIDSWLDVDRLLNISGVRLLRGGVVGTDTKIPSGKSILLLPGDAGVAMKPVDSDERVVSVGEDVEESAPLPGFFSVDVRQPTSNKSNYGTISITLNTPTSAPIAIEPVTTSSEAAVTPALHFFTPAQGLTTVSFRVWRLHKTPSGGTAPNSLTANVKFHLTTDEGGNYAGTVLPAYDIVFDGKGYERNFSVAFKRPDGTSWTPGTDKFRPTDSMSGLNELNVEIAVPMAKAGESHRVELQDARYQADRKTGYVTRAGEAEVSVTGSSAVAPFSYQTQANHYTRIILLGSANGSHGRLVPLEALEFSRYPNFDGNNYGRYYNLDHRLAEARGPDLAALFGIAEDGTNLSDPEDPSSDLIPFSTIATRTTITTVAGGSPTTTTWTDSGGTHSTEQEALYDEELERLTLLDDVNATELNRQVTGTSDRGISVRLDLSNAFWRGKRVKEFHILFLVYLVTLERTVKFKRFGSASTKNVDLRRMRFWSMPTVIEQYRPRHAADYVKHLSVDRSRLRVDIDRFRDMACVFTIQGYA